MKILLTVIIAIHGLIHLMGFLKAFNLAELNELKQPVTKTTGIIWLAATIMFIIALVMYLMHNQNWWITAAIAVVISQILIFQSWSDAKFGTAANIIILLPVIISFLNVLPSSFINIYRAEVQKRLQYTQKIKNITEDDLKHLPSPVSRYLHYTGVVGKPEVTNFRAVFKGKMKFNKDGAWMDVNSEQYNIFNDQSRLFFIESKMFGIPFDGIHLYKDNKAIMKIKVASFIQVVDAKGPEMNQSETVTFFNDMCIMAPATLIDKNIKWKSIDSLTAEAEFSINDNNITAVLYFNKKGELVNFTSNDRYMSADGKTYKKYKWSTPVKKYKEIDGRKFISNAQAIWHTPHGEFTYADFDIKDIEYNVTDLDNIQSSK